MNFVDELERLERLRQSGGLTNPEFEQAKVKLLVGKSSKGTDAKQLASLEKEMELARLDRAWESKKESYIIKEKWGRSRLPSVFIGVTNIVLGVGFGGFILWLASTFNSDYGVSAAPASWIGLAAGLFFTLGRLWVGTNECNKAAEYDLRERAYYRKRAQISRRSS